MARAEDPKAIYAVVREDGTVKTYQTQLGQNQTVTRDVMANISFAHLKSLDSKVILDDDGNLSRFEGTAEITVEYTDLSTHSLEITFVLEAKDYGTTSVPKTFVPEEYVASLESEIEEEDYDKLEEFLKNAPQTVSFMGQTFETKIEYYGGEG